jgi:hypothetical protein
VTTMLTAPMLTLLGIRGAPLKRPTIAEPTALKAS